MPLFKLQRLTLLEWVIMAALVGFSLSGVVTWVPRYCNGINVAPLFGGFLCSVICVALVLVMAGAGQICVRIESYVDRKRASHKRQASEPDAASQDLPPRG
jgi:hypothetical protein